MGNYTKQSHIQLVILKKGKWDWDGISKNPDIALGILLKLILIKNHCNSGGVSITLSYNVGNRL